MRTVNFALAPVLLGTSLLAQQPEWVTTHVRSNDPILNKTNLDRIKSFILKQGQRCTYSQMYNNNPCFRTASYAFYLNPDPGGPHNHPQFNINCDLAKGDFNTLVIRRNIEKDRSDKAFLDQYRNVVFQVSTDIRLEAHYAYPNMQVGEIRELAELGVKELLAAIDEQGRSTQPGN